LDPEAGDKLLKDKRLMLETEEKHRIAHLAEDDELNTRRCNDCDNELADMMNEIETQQSRPQGNIIT